MLGHALIAPQSQNSCSPLKPIALPHHPPPASEVSLPTYSNATV